MVKCCSKSEAVKLKPAKYLPLSAYSALCVRREDKLGKKIMKETLKGHAFIGTVKKYIDSFTLKPRKKKWPSSINASDWLTESFGTTPILLRTEEEATQRLTKE